MSGAGTTWTKCGNCAHVAPAEDLDQIDRRDLWVLVGAGEVMPHGQCLKCKAMCYAIAEPGELGKCPRCGCESQVTDTKNHGETYTQYLTCELCLIDFSQECEDHPELISTEIDQVLTEPGGFECGLCKDSGAVDWQKHPAHDSQSGLAPCPACHITHPHFPGPNQECKICGTILDPIEIEWGNCPAGDYKSQRAQLLLEQTIQMGKEPKIDKSGRKE